MSRILDRTTQPWLPGAAWAVALCGLAVALAATACSDDDGEATDAAVADSGQDADPDSPLRVGSPYTLELATWNLRNFPSDPTTVDDLAALLGQLELDFVAVQEIADVAAWQQLVGALNALGGAPYASELSPHQYSAYEYQKTGFLWRTDILELTDATTLFEEDSYAFPRPPFQGKFVAAHPGGWDLSFAAIVVHLKASFGEDNEARRRAAVMRLKDHIDELIGNTGDATGVPEPEETEVFLLGDFNDHLDDPQDDNIFALLLEDHAHYQILTSPLAALGDYTVLPWYGFIDHIVITADLQYEYGGGRTAVIPLDRAAELGVTLGYDYQDHISDHLPVVAILPWVDY